MVRVLSVYQFEEGSELTIADDINASCLVPPDRIALATSGLDVEIRSLANDSTKDFFTFPAVDEIEEIHYCRNGESPINPLSQQTLLKISIKTSILN